MIITEKELLEFFGEDEPKEIARYMSIWINDIARGNTSIKEFIEEMKDEMV
jgi:hypothetical protein